jgi:hypothetical protein
MTLLICPSFGLEDVQFASLRVVKCVHLSTFMAVSWHGLLDQQLRQQNSVCPVNSW